MSSRTNAAQIFGASAEVHPASLTAPPAPCHAAWADHDLALRRADDRGHVRCLRSGADPHYHAIDLEFDRGGR